MQSIENCNANTQRWIRHRFYPQRENKQIEGVRERCYSCTCEEDNTENSGVLKGVISKYFMEEVKLEMCFEEWVRLW